MSNEYKDGYIKACQNLNEAIDAMIDEVHDAYMDSNDRLEKHKLDAQVKILWRFKDRIESAIVDIEGKEP